MVSNKPLLNAKKFNFMLFAGNKKYDFNPELTAISEICNSLCDYHLSTDITFPITICTVECLVFLH